MKLSAPLLLSILGLASAQNLSGEPPCATACLSSAIQAAGCDLNDQACQCGTGQPAIQTAVTPCLLSACNAVDLGVAASVGAALCAAFSSSTSRADVFTIQTSTGPLPTSATSTVLSTTTTATTSNASPPTTSAASTGSAASSAAESASSALGSASSALSSALSSAASVATTTSQAGAPQGVVAGVGGVMGLVLGVVAAL